MPGLQLKINETELTIYRFPPDTEIPEKLLGTSFFSITHTPEELSIVCPSSLITGVENAETGWCSLQVTGKLDFSLTGILAGIASCLAEAGISIFAISTYDTDYILLKKSALSQAVSCLQKAGYELV